MVALHQNVWPWIFLLLATFAAPSLPGTWQSHASYMSQDMSSSQYCWEKLRLSTSCRWSIHISAIKCFCFLVEVEEVRCRSKEKQSDLQMGLLFCWLFNSKQFIIKLTFFSDGYYPILVIVWEMSLLLHLQ